MPHGNVEVRANYGCYVATAVYGSYDCPEVDSSDAAIGTTREEKGSLTHQNAPTTLRHDQRIIKIIDNAKQYDYPLACYFYQPEDYGRKQNHDHQFTYIPHGQVDGIWET